MEDPTAVNNTQMEARSAGEPGMNTTQQEGVLNAPLQMHEPPKNILALEEVPKPIVPAGQIYNHQNSCMHMGSPMCSAGINPRSYHYNHCQHRCPRSMNTAPMQHGPMGFGNLSINAENSAGIPVLRHNFDNAHARPMEQYCHHGVNRACVASAWHDNMPIQNAVQHTRNQNEPLIAAAAPAQNQALNVDSTKQVKNSSENPVNAEASEIVKTEMSTRVEQNANQQNQDQASGAEHHACANHTHARENTEHDAGAEEHSLNEERFNYIQEIRNKREISKGLTDDSAKSLIYFQGPDSDYSKIEKENASFSRSRRLHHTGQAVNSSQSSSNLNHQPEPIHSAIKPERKADNREELVPADVPVKDTATRVTSAKEETSSAPVNRVQFAETADDRETGIGDNSEGNALRKSESGFSLGDCFKLNPGAQLTRNANPNDKMRRNGLE